MKQLNQKNILSYSLALLLVFTFLLVFPLDAEANDDGLTPPSNVKVTVSGNAAKLTWEVDSANYTQGFRVVIKKTDVVPNKNVEDTIVSNNYSTSYSRSFELAAGEYVAQITRISNSSSYNNSEPVSSSEFVITASSGSSCDSSGGSSGSSGGSSDGSYIKPPTWDDGRAIFGSFSPGVATIDLTTFNHNIGIQVYKGKTKLADKVLGYYGTSTVKTSIPYKGKTLFQWRLYKKSGTTKSYTAWKKFYLSSKQLGKPGLSVTKISKNSAGLKWNKVKGASGYNIYKGTKKIKHVSAKTNRWVYKKKGAGSAKYQVAAEIRSSGKTYPGPKSKVKKGKANFRTYRNTGSTSGMNYGKAAVRPKKVSLSGNTYTVTFYALNSRIFKLIRFNKLDITLMCNGKKVAHKTFKNYRLNLGQNKSRKCTVRIKGKGGVDFRNAEGITIRWKLKPYWQYAGTKTI